MLSAKAVISGVEFTSLPEGRKKTQKQKGQNQTSVVLFLGGVGNQNLSLHGLFGTKNIHGGERIVCKQRRWSKHSYGKLLCERLRFSEPRMGMGLPSALIPLIWESSSPRHWGNRLHACLCPHWRRKLCLISRPRATLLENC